MRALSMALKLYVSGRSFSLRTQTQVARNALLTVRLVCPLFTLCSCEDVKAIYPRVRSPKPDWVARYLPFTTGAFGSIPANCDCRRLLGDGVGITPTIFEIVACDCTCE
jgi:hypothetical protein